MKLRLINFRCYSDNSFDFGEDGLHLISAPSGQGKSSILMAINFVLYGTGQKVVSHGQSSCSVEFTFQDLHIIRKKKPNKLTVKVDGKNFDDDVAQNIINQKFGTSFNVTGYIAQNALNSFIVMSPAEKLSFLEKFSFHDINLEEIRTRCKNLIQKNNEDFIKIISQTQTIEQVILELTLPIEVKFPIKTKNIELTTKNEEIRYKNCETCIKKNTHILSKTEKELNDTLILNSFIQNKDENIEGLSLSLEKLSIEEQSSDYIGDEELQILKKQLQNIIEFKDFKNIKFQFEESSNQLEIMKEKEIVEITTKLEFKKKSLWNEYSKEECTELIKELKGFLEDAKKISFLKKQIDSSVNDEDLEIKENLLNDTRKSYDEKREKLNILKKKKITYSCPCCKNNLFFENEKLHVFNNSLPELSDNLKEEDLVVEINSLNKNVKLLESTINKIKNKIEQNQKIGEQIENIENQYDEPPNIESFSEDIDHMENYLKTQNALEKEISILENNLSTQKFSSSYLISKNKVDQLYKQIKEYELSLEDIDENIFNKDEEDLRNNIFEEQNKKTLIKNFTDKRRKIEKELEVHKKSSQIKIDEHLAKYNNSIKSEKELNDIINTLKEESDSFHKKKDEHKENIDKIEKYKKYIEEKEKYDNWIKKLADLKEKEEIAKNKYNASKLLLEKIIESESIAMVNIVDTINLHSQVYLENFFPDNPIVVNLCCFKETKKNSKPQINVEISYKGSDCDITNLSGGETSRVILAFTLALAEIFNVPLLMLDECTASLDSESTSIVFDTIKEHFKNKNVLVVAHQCTEGVFDKIIKI